MKKSYKYIAISVVAVLFITWYITQMRLEVIKDNALLYYPQFRFIDYYYTEDSDIQYYEDAQFGSEEETDEVLKSIFNLNWERKLLLDPGYYLNQTEPGEALQTMRFFTQVKYDGVFGEKIFLIDGILYGDSTKINEIYYKYKGVEYVYTTTDYFDVGKLKQRIVKTR